MLRSLKTSPFIQFLMRSVFVLIGALSILILPECTRYGPVITSAIVGEHENNWFVYQQSPEPEKEDPRFLAIVFRGSWVKRTPVDAPLTVLFFDDREAAQTYYDIWPDLPAMSEPEKTALNARIFPHFFARYSRDSSKNIDEVVFFSPDEEHQIKETFKGDSLTPAGSG